MQQQQGVGLAAQSGRPVGAAAAGVSSRIVECCQELTQREFQCWSSHCGLWSSRVLLELAGQDAPNRELAVIGTT